MPTSAKARRCAQPSLQQYCTNRTCKLTIYLPQARLGDASAPAYDKTMQIEPGNEQSICLSQGQEMHPAQLTTIQCKQNLQMNNLFAWAKTRRCARPSSRQYIANKTCKWTIYLPEPRLGDVPSPAYGNIVQIEPTNEQYICLSQGRAMRLAQLVAMQCKDNKV